MQPALSSLYSFGQPHVQNRGILRVIAQLDTLNAKRRPNTTVMKWVLANGERFHFNLDWYATRIAMQSTPSATLYAVGPDGRALVSDSAGLVEESVDSTSNGPRVRGVIRDMQIVAGTPVAVGMGRQVYRRQAIGGWQPIAQGTLSQIDTTMVTGFNSGAGRDADDIVCVGFNGEIWEWNGRIWLQASSPTNVILNRVRHFPPDVMIACGQAGVLLGRRGGIWQELPQSETSDQIWDIEYFDGKLYFSTERALYTMSSTGEVSRVDFHADREVSCGLLHANDGVLMSSGTKDVWWTEDGISWHCLSE